MFTNEGNKILKYSGKEANRIDIHDKRDNSGKK